MLRGGVIDKHNFDKNHNYQNSLEEELFKSKYLIPNSNNELLEYLFNDYRINPNMDSQIALSDINRWSHIRLDESLIAKKFIGSIVNRRYERTISENIDLITRFIEEIKVFNPHIKIIFTLLPRYILMEKVAVPFLAKWKEEFESIMKFLCNKYNTTFIDFKDYRNISENHRFYYDVAHLNIIGGRCLTSMLNEII